MAPSLLGRAEDTLRRKSESSASWLEAHHLRWVALALIVAFLAGVAGSMPAFLMGSHAQQQADAYILWAGLGSITCAFTAGASIIGPIAARRARWTSRPSEFPFLGVMALVFLVGLLLSVALALLRFFDVIEPRTDDVPAYAPLALTGLVLALHSPLAASLVVLSSAFDSVRFENPDTIQGEDMTSIRRANNQRVFLLNLNGAAVVLMMFTTAALYRAYGEDALQNEFVWLTGAGLSFWLALLYLPVHMTMQRLVTDFLDAALPLHFDDQQALETTLKLRTALRQEIGFQGDLKQTLLNALAISAPFASGVIASAFEVS